MLYVRVKCIGFLKPLESTLITSWTDIVKSDLLFDRRMMFIYLLLFGNFISSIKGGIISFDLHNGETLLAGSNTKLYCAIHGQQTTYRIFQGNELSPLTTCVVNARCSPSRTHRYKYAILANGITIEIEKLERTGDEKMWTCMDTDGNRKDYYLTVFDVPASITLDGTTNACDLGTSSGQFTCKTNGCTYPKPTFTWFYSNNNGEPAAAFPKLGHVSSTSQANGCTAPAMYFQETLTLDRYTVFSRNLPTTIQLQCKMKFSQLPSVTRSSSFSRDVVFAVKVLTVNITDGGINLPDGELIVSENEPKSLVCTPGYGHPDSTVTWYIGGTEMATGQVYMLKPSNSFHGQQIYCVADNIPTNNVNDAESSKHALFVTVKTQYVYIQPAENKDLFVIENTPEPVVCISSPGRPRSTISWFKQGRYIGEGNETHFSSPTNNLEVTKSTRYFRVSRDDSGWILSCSASNFGESGRIEANNSKSFSVLYAPEHMGIMFDMVAVNGPTIDVIKGNTETLTCEASSNPPANYFSWNINSIQGNTFNIDDSIQNNQVVNCTAKNEMTTSSGTTVFGYGSISKMINLQYGAVIERLEVNGDANDTAIVKEHHPIFIACYVDSNPFSRINLFRGSSSLTAKERGTELIYNISSAQCSHTSPYICRARNGITNVEQPALKTVQINVECSPRLAADTDSLVSAKENTSAVLSLKILAYPMPTKYNWHRNTSNEWEEVINSTSIQMTQASLQFNLKIISVKPEDYGEYKLTVENGIGDPFDFTFILKANGGPEPHTHKPDDGSTAGIIGGVVGGLILVCAIVFVICFLRRRNSLDDIKTKLFGRKSSALRDDIQPQETGYSYAAVQKPEEGTALNIIDVANTETRLDGESSPASGYLYSEVNKSGRGSPMIIAQNKKASESTGGKNNKTKAAPETYENPALLLEDGAKAKPQKKGKPAKQKDEKKISQSHDGLNYVELSFSDTKKKGKKMKPAQPKADERTEYDAIQFGVVGATYTRNGEENDSKK